MAGQREGSIARAVRSDSAIRIVIVLAALVVITGGLRAAQSIVVPLLLAAFLTVLCAPALMWLRERGCPTAPAVAMVVILMMGTLALISTMVGASLTDFSTRLPSYQARLQAQFNAFTAWLEAQGVPPSEGFITDAINLGSAFGLASSMVSGITTVLSNALLILFIMIFMLLEVSSFDRKLRTAMADPEASLSRFGDFVENVSRYFSIKTWISMLTGLVVGIWVALLGIDFPLLWGLVAFLFNYIPNIGSLIAALPPVSLALVQFGVGRALVVAAGYLVINTVIGSGVEPRFMGRGLGLSPLVVFLSLVVWGWVLGPVGMFLSVPLTITLKFALESNDDTRWVAVLLGPEEHPSLEICAGDENEQERSGGGDE